MENSSIKVEHVHLGRITSGREIFVFRLAFEQENDGYIPHTEFNTSTHSVKLDVYGVTEENLRCIRDELTKLIRQSKRGDK